MSLVLGNWIGPGSFNAVFNHLSAYAHAVHFDPQGYASEFSDLDSIEDEEVFFPGEVDQHGNSPLFAAYNEHDLLDRIDKIQTEIVRRQNDMAGVGKCLRCFADRTVIGPLSRVACGLFQMLDIHSLRISYYLARIYRCYRTDNSLFCQQIRKTEVLTQIEDTLTNDFGPAETLLTEILGINSR